MAEEILLITDDRPTESGLNELPLTRFAAWFTTTSSELCPRSVCSQPLEPLHTGPFKARTLHQARRAARFCATIRPQRSGQWPGAEPIFERMEFSRAAARARIAAPRP